MNWEWDETKNQANQKKHGIDFRSAAKIFAGEVFSWPDDRFYYGEERFIGMGLLGNMVVVMVYTEDEATETIRILSIRRAKKHEAKRYYQNFFK